MRTEQTVIRRARQADVPSLTSLGRQLGYELVPEATAERFEAIDGDRSGCAARRRRQTAGSTATSP